MHHQLKHRGPDHSVSSIIQSEGAEYLKALFSKYCLYEPTCID